ncbi:MAG: hypothetical protein V4613_14205 [Bacteroidota bacterium]
MLKLKFHLLLALQFFVTNAIGQNSAGSSMTIQEIEEHALAYESVLYGQYIRPFLISNNKTITFKHDQYNKVVKTEKLIRKSKRDTIRLEFSGLTTTNTILRALKNIKSKANVYQMSLIIKGNLTDTNFFYELAKYPHLNQLGITADSIVLPTQFPNMPQLLYLSINSVKTLYVASSFKKCAGIKQFNISCQKKNNARIVFKNRFALPQSVRFLYIGAGEYAYGSSSIQPTFTIRALPESLHYKRPAFKDTLPSIIDDLPNLVSLEVKGRYLHCSADLSKLLNLKCLTMVTLDLKSMVDNKSKLRNQLLYADLRLDQLNTYPDFLNLSDSLMWVSITLNCKSIVLKNSFQYLEIFNDSLQSIDCSDSSKIRNLVLYTKLLSSIGNIGSYTYYLSLNRIYPDNFQIILKNGGFDHSGPVYLSVSGKSLVIEDLQLLSRINDNVKEVYQAYPIIRDIELLEVKKYLNLK